jgi:hypothetical protein
LPVRTHCWKRRWHVWYGGYFSGISRHCAPVLRTQSTPFSTARVSCHGLDYPPAELAAAPAPSRPTVHRSVPSVLSWRFAVIPEQPQDRTNFTSQVFMRLVLG